MATAQKDTQVKPSSELTNNLKSKANGALVVSKKSLTQSAGSHGIDPGKRINQLIKAQMPAIKEALGKKFDAEAWAMTALTVIKQTPQLLECSEISLLGGLMQASQTKLVLGSLLGQAYLVPRWSSKAGCKEATYQIGYRGLTKLAYQSGIIQAVMCNEVRENDKFEYEYGLNHKLNHVPAKKDRGELVCFYAYAIFLNGGNMFTVMPIEDVNKIRDKYSDAKKTSFSPWNDPDIGYVEMAKKTVLRRLCKNLPLSTEVMNMISKDDTVKHGVDGNAKQAFDFDIGDAPVIDVEPENINNETGEVKQIEGAKNNDKAF